MIMSINHRYKRIPSSPLLLVIYLQGWSMLTWLWDSTSSIIYLWSCQSETVSKNYLCVCIITCNSHIKKSPYYMAMPQIQFYVGYSLTHLFMWVQNLHRPLIRRKQPKMSPISGPKPRKQNLRPSVPNLNHSATQSPIVKLPRSLLIYHWISW